MIVREAMSRLLHSCQSSQTLADAARLLWEHDVGALPVLDGAGRLTAMITDRDVCMAAYTQGKALRELTVESARSQALFTCHWGDRLSTAERTMRVHQVRRLPVVDDAGRLVGVLSLADLARVSVASGKHGAPSHVDVTNTLATVSSRRRPESLESDGRQDTVPEQDTQVLPDTDRSQPPARIHPPSLAQARSVRPLARGLRLP